MRTGLGTSTAKEAKEYFSDMTRHRILFKYSGAEDDSSIILVNSHFNSVHHMLSWVKIKYIIRDFGNSDCID